MKDFWGYFWDAMFALVGFIMAMGLVVVFLALLWYALGITGMVTIAVMCVISAIYAWYKTWPV